MKTESYQRHIEYIRWPVKPRCAFCYSIITDKPVLYKNGWKVYRCPECKKDFTVLSNSPLQRTKLNPRQLWTLFYLIKYDKLVPPTREIISTRKPFQGVPSALSRRLGVHHWTMTKIINRVKGKTPEELLNKPGIAGMEEALTSLFQGDDKENIPLAIFLCTYKFITQDPHGLSAISGCTLDFAQKAIERIKESWEPGKEFEEDEDNWYNPDSWNSAKAEISLTLHCLNVSGQIKRDPITKMWSLKNEHSNNTTNDAPAIPENAPSPVSPS
jgi:hypothetical protein